LLSQGTAKRETPLNPEALEPLKSLIAHEREARVGCTPWLGGLWFFRRHYHYWDTPFADALFIERVANIGIGCVLPESFVLFAARFMHNVRFGPTAN
jgi:hypothetical protein